MEPEEKNNALIKKDNAIVKFDPLKKKELIGRGLREVVEQFLANNKNVSHIVKEGMSYYEQGKYQEAINCFKLQSK